MVAEWTPLSTLGRGKTFKWNYDREKIVIRKIMKYSSGEKEIEIEFTNCDIEKIILYIKQNGRVELANNVDKLQKGTEKDGIGKFIYCNVSKDIYKAQSSSQLVAILHSLGVLGYNGAKRNMEFWINDINWRDRILNKICEG